MKLLQIKAARYDTLPECVLDDLSAGITVFQGPHGCGKSTVVEMLRDVVKGRDIRATRAEVRPVRTGSVRVQVGVEIVAMSNRDKTTSPGSPDSAEPAQSQLRDSSAHRRDVLPEWVTSDVFHEILTVGYEDADRFDLLTRLCLDALPTADSTETGRVERAIELCISDRIGNDQQQGVECQIADILKERSGLQSQLDGSPVPSLNLQSRLDQVAEEIASGTREIRCIDDRLSEIEGEMADREVSLAALRQQNVLSLDRVSIESRIQVLKERIRRWAEIRDVIAADIDSPGSMATTELRPQDSLRSVRALVTRLEDRVATLNEQMQPLSRSADRDREVAATEQLRSEVSALCAYLNRHQSSVDCHEQGVEGMLTAMALTNAEHMHRLLVEQVECLRAELHRADDVLADQAVAVTQQNCVHALHREVISTVFVAGQHETDKSLHVAIEALQTERTAVVARRGEHEELLHSRNAVLARLQLELAAVPTLEQLDTLRGRIADCDARLQLLRERQMALVQAEADLRGTLSRLRTSRTPELFDIASTYIRRLTESSHVRVSCSLSRNELMVHSASASHPHRITELSRGTRHQVALALRLALVKVHSVAGSCAPLVLDDVFITSDDDRASEVVRLLTELAADGQQILFFTCQNDVATLFRRFDVDVRQFGDVPAAPQVPAVPRVPVEPVVAAVDDSLKRSEIVVPVNDTGGSNWLYYLEFDHGIAALARLQPLELEALTSAGIKTIQDLLDCAPREMDTRLRKGGFLLAQERLEEIRNQAEMACRVPMLRPLDAALLVAAGCPTTDELAMMRPEAVFELVLEFQKTDAGRDYRQHGNVIDQQQAINWSRSAQYARPLRVARNSRSRFSVRSNGRMKRIPRSVSAFRSAAVRKSRTVSPTSGSRRRAIPPRESRQRRAIRNARLRRQAHDIARRDRISKPLHAERPLDTSPAHGTPLRFYLSGTNPVVDAPSIGPKTAERLGTAGVVTVSDLLDQSAERISEKLSNRRLTAAVVKQWQAQSGLMCQVPELRGHDVQILVACGVDSPEALLQHTATELMDAVGPFSESKEGTRIIRGGSAPDLDEVSNWIAWARSSRSLRAA
jgi:energy-coupling factor transporter ATP-binding protein EcfA2